MSKHRIACLSLLLLAPGCSFDPSSLPGGPDDPGDTPDARPTTDGAPGVDGRAPDASPECDGAALQPALRVGGTLASDGQQDPVVEVLLGDVVEISATSSCGGEGTLSYQWAISPTSIAATADEDLENGPGTFTVYPTTAGDYTVTLTVRDGSGAAESTSALAIRAHDWQVAPVEAALSMGEVRDLAVGGGNLWLAAEGGPFSLPLAGPPDAFERVATSGDSVPNDLNAVLFDEGAEDLWFGHHGDQDGAWRLDMRTTPPASVQIKWDDSEAIGDSAQTRDLVGFEGTIIAVTSKGITAIDPTETRFDGQIQPDGQNPEALAVGNGRQLAGSQQIYDLVTNALFDSGIAVADDKIRAMGIDTPNEDLWVGTDGNGVASFDLRENEPIAVYTMGVSSGLGSNKIQALVVEASGQYAGDVWVATDIGIARYIRRRDTWIHMDEGHGLTDHLDVLSLAIDGSQGRRVIYAGSTAGVVYIRKP